MKIFELETSLSASTKKVAELGDEVKSAGDRAAAAELESGTLKTRVEELEAQLKAVRPEAEVISEYKKSTEYGDAIAESAADKLLRCWIVAEKLMKTNPEASFDKFTDLYIAVEEAHDLDGSEPEPYSGPNPIIPPRTAPDNQNIEDPKDATP